MEDRKEARKRDEKKKRGIQGLEKRQSREKKMNVHQLHKAGGSDKQDDDDEEGKRKEKEK